MIYLSDKAVGRNNNLNLIRFIAASCVLVSHAYPIALGPGAEEPFSALLGDTLGGLSVYAFFAISGFLIAASFERSSSYLSFLAARFLRLMPGLLISLLVVVFVLGPVVTSLPLATYLTQTDTWLFVVRNTTLISLEFHLPGVFEDNPYTAVEGSIWTLLYEVICYMGVFVVGVVGLLGQRRWMTVGIIAYLGIWFAIEIAGAPHPRIGALQALSLPFVLGTGFYVWRDKLPLSIWLVLGLTVVTVLAHGTVLYTAFLVLALSYTVFWLAYIPGGVLLEFNRLGDYSYGMYIYAFPLQGLAVWLFGTQTPLMNMALAFPATLVCAILSWYVIEKPALAAKPTVLAWFGKRERVV